MMLKKYCETGNTYYLRNMEEDAKTYLLKYAPYSIKRHSKNIEKYNRAMEVLDILGESPIHDVESDCDKLGFLKNTGYSCFLDSSLFGLFIFPCDFIQDCILYSKLKHRDKFYCGNTREKDLENRQKVQLALIDIESTIHDGKNVKTCTNLRKVLKNCPNSEKYHLPGMKDAGEFLQYILDMFPTNVAYKKTVVFGTNSTEIIIPKNDLYKTTERTDKSSTVIQFVDNNTLSKLSTTRSTDIRKLLTQVDDTGIFEGFTDEKSGKTFKRKITITTMESTPYLIFRMDRLNYTGRVLNTPILPSEVVSVNSEERFSLSAIVTYINKHYVCYFKCLTDWYLYDDLSGITSIGSYKDMIYSNPSPVKNGTLYFYIPFN